ncbi:MAG: hypothetical protein R2912_01795 [Eubacteriales bacterium]
MTNSVSGWNRPIRTTESAEEYPALTKTERDRIKDKGGFVGGQLRDNRRKRENVASRSMLTLDCDHADIGFINRFAKDCQYAACPYTTHTYAGSAAGSHYRSSDPRCHAG